MPTTNGYPAAFSSSRSTGSNKASSGQMTIGSSSSQGAQPTWLQAIIDRAQNLVQNVGNAAASAGNAVGPGAGGIGDSRGITGALPIGGNTATVTTTPTGGFRTADVIAGDPTGGSNTTGGVDNTGGGNDIGGDANGDPFTGFAAKYAPGFAGLLQQEPQALLAQSLISRGLSPNGGIFGTLAPLADKINPLMMLLYGNQPRTQSEQLNQANAFFQNMLTPGGVGLNYNEGLSRLLNAGSLGVDGQVNPLASFLNPRDAGSNAGGVDAEQQVRNFMSLYSPLVQNSTPLMMQGALMDQANLIARDYINALAQGKLSGGNFVDYLHARQPFQGY